MDKVVQQIDLKDIVLETDAPYLAPTPHRGKRNESAFVWHVAERLASIYEIDIEKIGTVTTENAKVLFKL